jgi:xanthine/uracil/vitamin C permease (AzgA family)
VSAARAWTLLLLLLLQLTYQQGMSVVLVTALLILVASGIGLRGRLMQLFPSHLVFAMVVGLGLFLTLVSWPKPLRNKTPDNNRRPELLPVD